MQQPLPHSMLDIICTPLVAFDEANRLGMGGGYYDRTLACWHEHQLGPRPLGLAHDCQQVDAVPGSSGTCRSPDHHPQPQLALCPDGRGRLLLVQ
jgi:5,10-methenyltetrahydrofolate synthetase